MSYQLEHDFIGYLTTGSAYLYALQDSRLYPAPLPERCVLPATTYQQIPGPEFIKTHGGPSGLDVCTYQFNCWAATHLLARQVADQLVWYLDNWIYRIAYINRELELDEIETNLFRVIVEAEIWRNP